MNWTDAAGLAAVLAVVLVLWLLTLTPDRQEIDGRSTAEVIEADRDDCEFERKGVAHIQRMLREAQRLPAHERRAGGVDLVAYLRQDLALSLARYTECREARGDQ